MSRVLVCVALFGAAMNASSANAQGVQAAKVATWLFSKSGGVAVPKRLPTTQSATTATTTTTAPIAQVKPSTQVKPKQKLASPEDEPSDFDKWAAKERVKRDYRNHCDKSDENYRSSYCGPYRTIYSNRVPDAKRRRG